MVVMTQPDPTTPALYDAGRGGAIWDHLMTRTDGRDVAGWMVEALREAVTEPHPVGWSWQSRALELAFPDDDGDAADGVWFAVASNVLIELHDDFKAQVREAEARGDLILPPTTDVRVPV